MRAIVVDDEPIMLQSFMRNCADIPNLEVVAQFQSAEKALAYAEENTFDLALLDVCMPCMDGIELAVRIRDIHPNVVIVFISAYDDYVRNFNEIGGDYYILKPYKRATIEMMVNKMSILSGRLHKDIYIQMFGTFNVFKNGVPVRLIGKTKELMALIATRRGKEISNETLFSIVWEDRDYSNQNMTVYYNAVRRLKNALANSNASELLISTSHGQMLNTAVCDCDYFAWKDGKLKSGESFEGEFLPEYAWAESLLGEIIDSKDN